MSNRIRRIDLSEYELLLKFATIIHANSNEPIPEVSENGLLMVDSCLKTPFMKVLGYTPHVGFINKVTVLFYIFNKTHCLANGNKRMACLTLGYF